MFSGEYSLADPDAIEDRFFCERILSILQTLSGLIGFICGIVTLHYGMDNIDIPISVAAGIWTSLIVIVSGLCGFASTFMIITLYNKHIKNLLIAQWVIGVISLFAIIINISLSVWIYLWCSGNGNFPDWCYPHNHQNWHAAIANMAAGCVMVVFTLPVIVHFCRLMKLYKDIDPNVIDY